MFEHHFLVYVDDLKRYHCQKPSNSCIEAQDRSANVGLRPHKDTSIREGVIETPVSGSEEGGRSP